MFYKPLIIKMENYRYKKPKGDHQKNFNNHGYKFGPNTPIQMGKWQLISGNILNLI